MSDGHEHVDVEGHKASMGSPFRTKVGGNHGAPVPAASSGLSPPPGFGIITLRTGWGLYVFATRSSRSPASHPSSPSGDCQRRECLTQSGDVAPSRPRPFVVGGPEGAGDPADGADRWAGTHGRGGARGERPPQTRK